MPEIPPRPLCPDCGAPYADANIEMSSHHRRDADLHQPPWSNIALVLAATDRSDERWFPERCDQGIPQSQCYLESLCRYAQVLAQQPLDLSSNN